MFIDLERTMRHLFARRSGGITYPLIFFILELIACSLIVYMVFQLDMPMLNALIVLGAIGFIVTSSSARFYVKCCRDKD